MKTLTCEATIDAKNHLVIPKPIAKKLPRNRPLRLVIVLGDDEEDREWERLGAIEFLKGYAKSDAIYDDV